MSKKKSDIRGYVYYTNDSLFLNTRPKKRRVVSINNDPKNMRVRRILSAGKGRNSQHGVPIEIYHDIPKPSVVEARTFSKTRRNKPIVESRMRKSKTRLNESDQKKLGIKKR